MDYIKKALEKAKKEGSSIQRLRKEAEGAGAPPSETLRKVWGGGNETESSPPAPPVSKDISPPQYSQTRRVEVDTNHLIDQRVFSILDNNPVADQYKLLRTVILHQTRPKHLNAIGIVSYKDGEGKTLTAVNFAITLAKESRQTVLLVDADLRRPSVHDVLGIDLKPGLCTYLQEGAELKDLLIHPGIESLTVLPAGGRMPNSTEAIGSFRMEQLVREIKGRYPDRYVVFDTPALFACADALILSAYLDGVMVVVRSGYTERDDLINAMNLFKERIVFGVVLNEGEVRQEWAY